MGNQIEEIQKLYAKKKSYSIPAKPKKGQAQALIEIAPMGLDDVATLDVKEDATMSEISANAKKLFAVSLGITEAEAGKLSFEFMQELMDAIMDANNFKPEDLKKTGVKKFLDDKRKQIKEKEALGGKGSTPKA